ncbi:ABC transporter permease [Nguyenibacter sp. L1]|uniref:ABC transporter permease n=1 Tax=Nguyenibacter sp. L1 TaxID=3049350 RepID=UPI002B45C74F|nr:ABC transporter permease [Nguyenibacter sp. L1]WRH89759.1 ABC transporter permease [Nguyenibacter sp. L1]
MARFLLQKLGVNCILLVLVSMVGFILVHATPGGPLAQFALSPGMTSARLAEIAHDMGLDSPLWQQYLHWSARLAAGDWGRSYRDQAPVLTVIWLHLGATAQLALASLILSFPLGVALGIIAALQAGRRAEHLASLLSVVLLSLPTFWLGLVFIYVFSVRLGWFPAGNLTTPGHGAVTDHIRHLALPSLTLGLVSIPLWSNYTRAFAGEIWRQDHIRTARALGIPTWRIVVLHLLPEALLPLVPVAGIYLPTLLSGALVTETVFTWPGIGRLLLDSLQYRDYPMVMGLLVFSAALVLLCSLAAEILHHLCDPRLRG